MKKIFLYVILKYNMLYAKGVEVRVSIRRKIKKTISLCIVAMLILVLPEVKVHAYDDTEVNIEGEGETASNMDKDGGEDTSPVEESGEKTDTDQQTAVDTRVDNKVLESSAVEYIYIDAAEIKYSETQNIVVALTDTGVIIHEAQIELLVGATGEIVTLSASKIVDNTCLFEGIFNQSSLGEISLHGFRYKSADGEIWNQVELSDVQKTSFAVTEETNDVNTYSNEITPEITAYAFDESGEIKEATGDSAADVVEEVMEAANLETVAVPYARSRSAEPRSGELVIALDPGHDSHCGGASANGLTEHVLTLKIANYCKAELEQYTNVKVLMTRTSAVCPNPLPGKYNSPDDILQRVDKAKAQGADVIVSFHLNSSPSGSANGAEVIYQNRSYDANISMESEELAQKIQDQLVNLGLRDRGIKWRDADTEGGNVPQKDENGLTEDYWTFHNEAKAVGMPAVLIEHAFLSGNSDSVRLKNESFLQELGIADATGIANKYGLVKGDANVVPSIGQVSFERVNGMYGTFDIVLKDIEGEGAVKNIQIAVWSAANGQDDLIWYDAKRQSDGTYKATVNIKDHNGEFGIYCAHAFIDTRTGGRIFGNSAEVNLQEEKVSGKVTAANITNGSFEVRIENLHIPGGMKELRVPVWSVADGQDDIIWYTPQKLSDNTYTLSVNIADHGYSSGLYMAHVYATDTYDKSIFIGMAEANLKLPEVNIIAEDSSGGLQETYSIKASNVGYYKNVRNVDFAVWSEENGQDDILWYAAQQNASGIWQAEVDMSKYTSQGNYIVHTYATFQNGSQKFLGSTEFKVAKNQPVSIGKVDMTSTGEGKFRVTVSNVTGGNQIEEIRCPVWSSVDGQDDILWYTMDRKSDGTFVKDINIADHKYSTGTYNAHIYIVQKNGSMIFGAANTINVKLPAVEIFAENTPDAADIYQLSASNLGYYGNIQNVKFAVWSEVNWQDDLVWYESQRDGTGVWKVSIDAAKHKSQGAFLVHAYATLSDGSLKLIGATGFSFNMQLPTAEKVEFDTSKYNSQGIVEITVTGVKAGSGVNKVSLPVWSEENGQDDLIWHEAENRGNGIYKASFSLKDHKYSTGLYNVHVYVTDNSGNMVLATAGWFNLQLPEIQVVATPLTKENNVFELTAANVGIYGTVKEVRFAVWSEENGQNDINWYSATQNSSTGVWKTNVDVNNHDVSGKYLVHVYAILSDGSLKYIANTSFNGTKLYKIMGTSEVTEAQMVNFFRSKGRNYPGEALGKGGAATIEEFCHILFLEAKAEGVKAEVVFAQAMLETGYLKFGGDVKIEQFNFAGIGATGHGVPGNSFKNVTIGLRAQTQHLKCYASTEPLNQKIEDPRWAEYLRGTATSVEELSWKWAENQEYGNNITNLIKQIKSY